VRGEGWTHTESEAYEIARKRLDEAIERFRELGVEVEGHVGDERPLDAMRDAMRRVQCDEIILSTLPRGASRWLRMDLVARTDRAFPVPVTHVEATEDV
jgi:GABA permease